MGSSCGRCGPNSRRDSPPSVILRKISDKGSSNTGDQISSSLRFEIGRKSAKPPALNSRLESFSVTEAPNAVVSSKPQTHWEAQTISMAIHRHSVLTDLTEDARDVIISRMQHYRLGASELVFEQGSQGSHFFVVGSGALEVLVNNIRVNLLKSGDSFGELALLHNVPRTATVKTTEKSDLWGLDRKTFKEAVEQVNIRSYSENQAFIDSVGVFKYLTPQEKDNLLSALSSHRFFPGKQIVTEGEPGDIFYLIKEGTVTCSCNGVEIRKMHKGEYFGEQALMYNTTRTATITADDTVRVLSVGRDQLVEVLGHSLQQVLYRNTLRIAFDQSEFLNKLTLDQKEKVIDGMAIKSFKATETVIGKDEDLNKVLRVVLKGEITGAGVEYKMFACVGDGYGQLVLGTNLVATGDVDIAVIEKVTLESILGGQLVHVTSQNETLAVLKKVSIFRGFPSEKLNRLLSVIDYSGLAD